MVHSGYPFYQYVCSLGIKTHDLCPPNRATGTNLAKCCVVFAKTP